MDQKKGFFASLFDFSFTSFITPRTIKLLYAIPMACAAIFAILLIIDGFNSGDIVQGVLILLIGAPLFFFLSVLYLRVCFECIVVLFRIAEQKTETVERGSKGSSK
jgi:hypothetical protein